MNNFQIFSDSSCDLPIELLSKYNIKTIPFYITFDKENYYKEIEELSIDDFYKKLTSENIFPKTSLPSVQDYINAFEVALKKSNDLLCICLTEKFSGSYQSAVNAKTILEEKYPASKIEIVNSMQATGGQGLVVLQAAHMQKAGYTLDEVVEKVNILKQTARIMFTVNTLEYLQKGGRVGKAASLAGTMLNLKPLIQLKEGELIPYGNVRGRKKSLEKIIDMASEHFMDINEPFDDYEFIVVHSLSDEETLQTKDRLEALTGKPLSYPLFTVGVTIGTNTGPYVIGIAFIKKYNKI